MIDNINMALQSLKQNLSTYLDDNGWKKRYNLFIAGDNDLVGKEIVENITNDMDKRKYVSLPLIVIEIGTIRNDAFEIGNSDGRDQIMTSIIIHAADEVQLIELSNFIRRKINDLSFNVYDFRYPKRELVGTAVLSDIVLTNLSDSNASHIAERNVNIINSTMDLDASNLI